MSTKIKMSSTIDKEIYQAFKDKCLDDRLKMNEVIEAFMSEFLKGSFGVEKNLSLVTKKSLVQ